jgi:septal ring factor EnvC (AmiA/AmiB activator)
LYQTLLQVHMLSINYERAEAGLQCEAASAVEQLQQQLAQLSAERQEADSKLSAAGQALEAATSEIEQLTAALQDAELLQQLRRQQELVVEHQQAAVEVCVALLPCLYVSPRCMRDSTSTDARCMEEAYALCSSSVYVWSHAGRASLVGVQLIACCS